eukprot:22622_1
MTHKILQVFALIISLSSNIYLSTSQNCYAQYDCNDGYMDITEGAGFYWACGSECPGQISYTDIGCGCACVPEDTCQPTGSPIIPTPQPSSSPTIPQPSVSPINQPSEVPTLITALPTYSATSTTSVCIWGRAHYNSGINGAYYYENTYNNKSYYRKSTADKTYYLWWDHYFSGSWRITSSVGYPTNNFAYCTNSTLFACNKWIVWGGDIWAEDHDVYVKNGSCPSWDCDSIIIPYLHHNCDKFDIHVGNNVWVNSNYSRWFYFDNDRFSWMCDNNVPEDGYIYYKAYAEDGWWDLRKGDCITVRFAHPNDLSFTIYCIDNYVGDSNSVSLSGARTYSKYLWLNTKTHWERAQFMCEYVFGTNLATINVNDDWNEAKAVINNLGLSDYRFYIGLNDIDHNGEFEWIDNTLCNYTSSGSCNDSPYFFTCTIGDLCEKFRCCTTMSVEGVISQYPCIANFYDQAVIAYPNVANPKEYFMCSSNLKYTIIIDNYTWLDASNYCTLFYSELGLATIINNKDRKELTSLTQGSGVFNQLIWLGGSSVHGCNAIFQNEIQVIQDCKLKLPFVCYLNDSITENETKLNEKNSNFLDDGSNYWIRKEQYHSDEIRPQTDIFLIADNRWSPRFGSPPSAYWNNKLYFVGYDYKIWNADIYIDDINHDVGALNNSIINLEWTYTRHLKNLPYSATLMDEDFDFGLIGGYSQSWTQFENWLFFIFVGAEDSWSNEKSDTIIVRYVNIFAIDLDIIHESSGEFVTHIHTIYTSMRPHENILSEYNSNNPFWTDANDICMVTNGTHLFVISNKIYFYNVQEVIHDSILDPSSNSKFQQYPEDYIKKRILTKWEHDTYGYVENVPWLHQSNGGLFDDLTGVGCSINYDNTKLFIFGGYRNKLNKSNDVIFKYDILNDKLYEINIPLPKSYMFTKTILAPNGNIYFYGNTTQQRNDQYLIFNSKIEQFDSRKHTKDLYYKPRVISSAAISKSNMLIRLDYKKKFFFPKRVQNIDISYLITNRVSIDLRPLSQQIIDPTYNGRWPILRDHYKMIEYTNKPNNYSFIFSINIFNTVIQKIVNISYETCIFCDYENSNDNEYSNNCFDCAIGINLITDTSLITAGDHQSMVHIKLNDNSGIDDLLLFTNHGSANQNSANEGAFSFLIHTPCIIYFDSLNNLLVNTGDNIEIIGNYKFDNYCVDIENDTVSKLTFISEELSINKQVTFIGYNCTSIVDIQFPEDSSPCDYGLRPILTNITRQIYNIEIKSSNTNNMMTAIPSLIQIKINECALGEGLIPSSSVIECQKCEINQFKVIEGFLPCYNCEHEIEGVSCLGSDQILIDYNYWSSGYNMQKNIFPIDIELVTNVNNDKMYSHMCPPMYCCNKKNGCLYINDSTGTRDSESLCANGRFATSILCSKCVADKYELFGSTTCGACSEYNWLLLGIIFVLALSFVIFIFIDSSKINLNPYKQNEINWKYLFIKDEQMFLKIMIFKVMTYYFQSLSQILSNKGINHVFIPILGLFNFSIDEMYNNKNGICVIPYLDALNEIIFSLIFIMFIIFHFIWLSIGLFGYRSYNSTDSEKN